MLSADDLPANMRLLCSYDKSISRACRRIGINRQQFTKYLSGAARPSLFNLRRIGDYFGLEDYELLLPHEDFRRIVSIRRPSVADFGEISEQIRNTLFLTSDGITPLLNRVGFYHNYFMPLEFPGRILRGLFHVYEKNGFVLSRNIERYPQSPGMKVKRFNGVFVHTGDKIVIFERESTVGRSLWLTVLNPYDQDQRTLLPGLAVGVTRSSGREIACYRVVMEYLGRQVDLRAAIRRCGLYEGGDEAIDADIVRRIRADILPHEYAFVARL
jgi:transcriptional regulator with XRE-family HTH domain